MSSSEAEPAEEPPEDPGADQIKEEPLEVAKSKSSESAEERERDVDMNAEHGPAVYGGEAPPAQKSDDANMSPSPRRAAPASGSASAPEPEPPVRVPSQAATASGLSWETCSDDTLALARATAGAWKAWGGRS